MTLPLSGHQTRAVTFGCMAKGRGVSSRASPLISAKILVGNAVSSGHQAKAVSSSSRLVVKMQIKKDKAIRAWKKCIHDGYSSPPTKAPTDNTNPWSDYDWTSLKPHHYVIHGLNDLLRGLSISCGRWPNRWSYWLSQPCIVGLCLSDDLLGISCIHLINLMMRYDLHCYDV
jgi:hypothetical protein